MMLSDTARQALGRVTAKQQEKQNAGAVGVWGQRFDLRAFNVRVDDVYRLPVAVADEVTVQNPDGTLAYIEGWSVEPVMGGG